VWVMDYPVIFKCCECEVEHSTLEQLEIHIWNRHLQTFPFHCALCNYPALSEKALTVHYFDAHPKKSVEFKRKIIVETQLRDLIASSIVVPVYEDDATEAEVIYEEETVQDGLGDMETLQPVDQDGFEMEEGTSGHNVGRRRSGQTKEAVDNDQWEEHPPNLKRIEDDSEVVYLDSMGRAMNGQDDGVHMQNDDVIAEEEVEEEMVMGDGGEEAGMHDGMMEDGVHDNNHQDDYIYEDGNMFEEGEEGDEMGDTMEYVDEDGNIFYQVHHKPNGGRSDHHIRLMKNRHMEMIVRKVAEDPNDMRKKPSTVEECDICGKILKYPSRIEAHRRMHSQVKLFQCPHCVKQFAQKSSLNVHMRKHTGERTYLCTWECGKSFYSSSALRLHEKSHSGERKHSCSVCGQLFSKRSHVVRHEKNRHSSVIVEDVEEEEVLTGEEQAVVDEVVESVHIERCNKLYNKQQQRMMRTQPEMPSLHG
ncbi:hypothetical protein PFISCL1PPCAC_19323, partial [Pristionchus fissidentatus]